MSPMYLWIILGIHRRNINFGIFNMLVKLVNSGLNSVGQCWMLYIVFEKYFKGLYCKSHDLGWFACFRIQFLPDHIMIHSCLV